MRIISKLKGGLGIALFATLFYGASGGIVMSVMNNYLADVYGFNAEMRGWLELPREFPGFVMVLITGFLLVYMRETQAAALAMLFTILGVGVLVFSTPAVFWLMLLMVIWSIGDHIIFALEGPIGLKLATKGKEGRRLGQFGAARNLGTIAGTGLIYVMTRLAGNNYHLIFGSAILCALIAGILYWQLKVGGDQRGASRKIVFKKKYSIYYTISMLGGVRKQIFLVFGGWVLVKLYQVDVGTIAGLYFAAAVLGVIFRPLLGDVIDWLGERKVLSAEQIILILICLTYAFASQILPKPWDKYLLYATFIMDSLLFALRVARTTYLKKIAEVPSDITPNVSLGLTLDHAVAMSLPALSGLIWETWGYRWVFILASLFAVAGFFVCLRIRIPEPSQL